ncbi:MAG TPA: glycoside hydrolase family 2 TIM barrel-domain containing protein [Meiothermus sp.]|nr:glycoside hydrolase family 2 TIM barrel-domain containing protein [Meiothermus sp.]
MSGTAHPNPLLERAHWRDLNGPWRFAYDDEARWHRPAEVEFDREIIVPYAPESAKSGVGEGGYHPVVWYARRVQLEPHERAGRLLLHFGAVDYQAKVWANGVQVAEHKGGHTPFCADVTEAVAGLDTLEIVVRAEDDPHDLARPRGKQDWEPEPHVIWYPRTTGIWQTVWLEPVPPTWIENLRWTPEVEAWAVGLEVKLAGPLRPNLRVRVRLFKGREELLDDTFAVKGRRVSRRLHLQDPGIDDERSKFLWSPEHPHLIGARVELLEADTVTDTLQSYTALRSIGTDGHRFTLNGSPYRLRLALDQGYWPDTLLTAPSDEALRRDVEMAKLLGFNGVRKHQKLEDPRWLYWCDRLGLLVWEEMPSAYRFHPDYVGDFVSEWREAIERDYSHPCIIAWVPFNESWGAPDLNTNQTHRHYVQTLYHLTKTLDPTRLAIGNDGWEFVVGDWVGIHDYTHKPEKLLERYGTPQAVTLTVEQPWGRALRVQGFELGGQPVVLSEFGGMAFSPEAPRGFKTSWGYSRAQDSEAFLTWYEGMMQQVHLLRGIAGFCYTQLTDTFQEKNGLLDEHRNPKADLARLRRATKGERKPTEEELEPDHPMGYSRHWKEEEPT